MEVELMPNAVELAVKLARQLERNRILADLKLCTDINDLHNLVQKYEILCQEDENN